MILQPFSVDIVDNFGDNPAFIVNNDWNNHHVIVDKSIFTKLFPCG